jgi:hypothetical protein
MAANELILDAPWDEVKEKLKEVHPALTDADLAYDPQDATALLEHLAHVLNKDVLAVKAWIESVSSNKSIAS